MKGSKTLDDKKETTKTFTNLRVKQPPSCNKWTTNNKSHNSFQWNAHALKPAHVAYSPLIFRKLIHCNKIGMIYLKTAHKKKKQKK